MDFAHSHWNYVSQTKRSSPESSFQRFICQETHVCSIFDEGMPLVLTLLVQMLNGSYVPVTSLDVGSRVLAASGKALIVMKVAVHDEQSTGTELVEIRVDNANLWVTPTHRVMILGRKGPTSVPAAKLVRPCKVLCSNDMACTQVRC